MSKEQQQPPTYEQLSEKQGKLASLIGKRKATLGRIGTEGTQHPLFTTDTGDLKIARVSDRLAGYIAGMEAELTQVGSTMDTLAIEKAQLYQHDIEIHAGILAGIKAHAIPQTQVLVEHHETKHQGMLAQAEENPVIKRGLELIAQKEAAEKPKAVPTPIGSIEDFQEPKKVETKAKKEPLVERVLPNGHTITLGSTEAKILDVLPNTKRKAVNLVKAVFGGTIKAKEITAQQAAWRISNALQFLRPKLTKEGYDLVTVLPTPEKRRKGERARYYYTDTTTEKRPKDIKPREPRPARPAIEAKPFQIAEGVTVIGLRPKEEEILLHIQCYPNQTSKAQIAKEIWPDAPLEEALGNLSTNLANIRAKIKPAGYYVNIVKGNYLLETSQRSVPLRPEKKPGIPQEPAPSDTLSGEGKKI